MDIIVRKKIFIFISQLEIIREYLQCYVLLAISSRDGKLPWSEGKSDADVCNIMESCNIMKLAKDRNCNEVN